MYPMRFQFNSFVYFCPSSQYIRSRNIIQKNYRNITKFITTNTEKYELALLGKSIVMGQKGSLNKTNKTDNTTINFCYRMRSPTGTLLYITIQSTQARREEAKNIYLIIIEYLVNSGLTVITQILISLTFGISVLLRSICTNTILLYFSIFLNADIGCEYPITVY